MVYIVDAEFLARAYPDLKALPPWKRVIRWFQFGRNEGRFASRAACDEALNQLDIADFSASDYLAANQDLVGLVDSEEQALVHYLSLGIMEGRLRSPKQSVVGMSRPNVKTSQAVNEDLWEIPLEQFGITPESRYLLGRYLVSEGFRADNSLLRSPEFEFLWNPWPELTNEAFVSRAYLMVLQRCPDAHEFDSLLTQLDWGQVTRLRITRTLMEEKSPRFLHADAATSGEALTAHVSNPEPIERNHSFTLLGSRKLVTADHWRSKAFLRSNVNSWRVSSSRLSKNAAEMRFNSEESADALKNPACTVIVSTYNGSQYLEAFCTALKAQTIFNSVEVVVVDANSHDGTLDELRRQFQEFQNVRIIACTSRISVYEAWNLAIAESQAPFITNWNIDDMRHAKSLETQVKYLENLPMVDVCYQDVWLSFKANLSFDQIVEHGMLDIMNLVSARTLYSSNYVHNGPMWRRELHTKYGLFDTDYRSAADWEFWLRCVLRGATFGKCAIPTVAYYVNPDGVSTRPGTTGVEEAERIRKRYINCLRYPDIKMICSVPPVERFPARHERLGAEIVSQYWHARLGGELSDRPRRGLVRTQE